MCAQLKAESDLRVVDGQGRVIRLDDLKRNAVVKAIVCPAYVWVHNGTFGATWKVVALRVVREAGDHVDVEFVDD
jgi:hypothetical protein